MKELDADRPPTPADAMAIIERERDRTQTQLSPDASVLTGMWGVVWLLGGLVQLAYLQGGITAGVAGWTGTGLLVAASAASIVLGVRSGRGLRGGSETQGARYGWTWTIAMVAMSVVVGAVAGELPPDVTASLVPSLFVLLVGVLYLAGGALWADPVQYLTGIWITAVAVVAVLVGAPASALVLGIGGGGGLLTAAAWYRRR